MRRTLRGHALSARAILLHALKVLTKYILCYSAAAAIQLASRNGVRGNRASKSKRSRRRSDRCL